MKIEFAPKTKATTYKTYPWIGDWKGNGTLIVLFVEQNTGFPLKTIGNPNFSNSWAENEFVPYEGSITLTQ